jgi:hypothetical protein
VSKFLLNLLVQISKALLYSKIQFLLEKKFSSTFGPIDPVASRPIRPSGHTAQPVIFFLLPHWSRARKPPPPASLAPPPWSAPTTSTGWKIMAASLHLHSPIKRCPSPSSIPGNWCLQSGGVVAPSTPSIEGTRSPLPLLQPIKGCPTLGEDPHTSSASSLSPHHALTTAVPSRGSTAGETPLHRLLTRGDPVVELAYPSFPSLTPWSELSSIGADGGQALVSSQAWQWLPVHGGSGRHDPPHHGFDPRNFLL